MSSDELDASGNDSYKGLYGNPHEPFKSADTPVPYPVSEEESTTSSVELDESGDDSYEDVSGSSGFMYAGLGMPVPHHLAEGEPRISEPKTVEAGDDIQICTVLARLGEPPDRWETLRITLLGEFAGGNSYTVEAARLPSTNESVTVKKVSLHMAPSTQELNILRRLQHCNIAQLKFFFYTADRFGLYLSLVMEFLPHSLDYFFFDVLSLMEVKLYSYQMFRALAYLHSSNICHRDLKPENILVDPTSGILKLSDLCRAIVLDPPHPINCLVGALCYKAPELLLGTSHLTCKVDVWSAGCILAEMLGKRLFRRSCGCPDALDTPYRSIVGPQLFEIFKVTGTPTIEDIHQLKLNFAIPEFPPIAGVPWTKALGADTPPEVLDLISNMLKLRPLERTDMLHALAHSFYDELRQPGARFSSIPLPPLFNFTPQELAGSPHLFEVLVPPHHRQPGTSQPVANDDGQVQPPSSDSDQPDPHGSN